MYPCKQRSREVGIRPGASSIPEDNALLMSMLGRSQGTFEEVNASEERRCLDEGVLGARPLQGKVIKVCKGDSRVSGNRRKNFEVSSTFRRSSLWSSVTCSGRRRGRFYQSTMAWLLTTVSLLSALLREGACVKQSFRVTPSNQEVVAGTDIVLPCEVNNQQGDAQWTRHGFALGFDRSVVGLTRYQMVGDSAAGVHNLEIRNVSMEDDGEFQCQVTPYNNARPIRASARVSVLLPPASITLEGREDAGGAVTVGAGEQLSLTCLVRNAKPVATVQWRRNGETITLETQQDTEEDGDEAPRKSLRSRITITPSQEDNGANYTCAAQHSALTELGTTLEVTVTIDVLYEPGAPEISGFREGEIVRAGDRKVLTCRSRGGNPVPDVFWYKNGRQIDKKFLKHRKYAINEYDFVVEASDNKAKYECQVQNVRTAQPKKASIKLRVNFPPSSVTISAPDNVKVGDNISLSCTADNSNPPADVSLVINGQTPPGTASSRQKTENGGFNTVTNLVGYEIRTIDTDLVVTCYAHNQPLASTKVDTKVITVLRPPGPPVIIGYDGGRLLRKGDRHRLTCVSSGGNPLATLQWYKGDQKLDSSDVRENEGSAVAELDMVLAASDNGAVYKCEATNPATETPLSNSTTLSVAFPPAGVQVQVTPDQVHAGEPATLRCSSSSSYPASNVTWWRGGEQLREGDWTVEDGEHGGTITVHSVIVHVVSSDDGAVFTCQADNGLLPTTHDAITLDIQYKPVFVEPNDQLPREVQVTEGEAVFLNASAHGKPSILTYTWRRGGEVVAAGRALNLSQITRAQDGLYTVEATNTQGSTYRNVSVRVKYVPTIVFASERQVVDQNSTLEVECRADGLPAPTVTWTRDGYNFDRTEKREGQSESVLAVKGVTVSDTGRFLCKASNEVGETSKNVTVVVNHKPILDTSPRFQKAGAEMGSTGRLICRATGSPFVSFTWFTRDKTPIEPALYSRFGNRYTVIAPVLVDDLATYESVLEIKNVTSQDHGTFQCQAINSLGYRNSIVRLEGTSPPDAPTNLKVLNTTHNSALLEWTPGYDGGLEQSFRVRYHSDDVHRYQYADVYPHNATVFTLTGLALSTSYSIAVQARNEKGESPFSPDGVRATTDSAAPPSVEDPPTGEVSKKGPGPRVPSLLATIITLVGAALLVLNIALVACFFRRRASKRVTSTKGWAPMTEVERAITRVLEDKAAMPRVVTLAISSAAGLLVIVNVILIVCVLRRRRQQKDSQAAASSDKGSSKSTTLEMYAPSSYNGTVNGETLSSISEKSRESYAQENDSADEYDMDAARVTANSNYLIEQLEPPPQYASARRNAPLHIVANPVAVQHNNLDYDKDGVRNQYNASLDRNTPNYGTLGRRGEQHHMPPDLYSPASEPPLSANRYNTYHPSTQQPPLHLDNMSNLLSHHHPQIHGIPSAALQQQQQQQQQQNGTLHRTQAPKLQFPRDFIRSGSSGMNIPVSLPNTGLPPHLQQQYSTTRVMGDPHSHLPGSPTRTLPGGTIGQPMLTTFSGDHTPPTTTLPIEQRGHLV